jgi:hypothetical protein
MIAAEVMASLEQIRPAGRAILRLYLIADERASKGLLLGLYREGSPIARGLADLVDVLDASDEARRQVTRILGEIEVATTS